MNRLTLISVALLLVAIFGLFVSLPSCCSNTHVDSAKLLPILERAEVAATVNANEAKAGETITPRLDQFLDDDVQTWRELIQMVKDLAAGKQPEPEPASPTVFAPPGF